MGDSVWVRDVPFVSAGDWSGEFARLAEGKQTKDGQSRQGESFMGGAARGWGDRLPGAVIAANLRLTCADWWGSSLGIR